MPTFNRCSRRLIRRTRDRRVRICASWSHSRASGHRYAGVDCSRAPSISSTTSRNGSNSSYEERPLSGPEIDDSPGPSVLDPSRGAGQPPNIDLRQAILRAAGTDSDSAGKGRCLEVPRTGYTAARGHVKVRICGQRKSAPSSV
jgi:hypothetical protein